MKSFFSRSLQATSSEVKQLVESKPFYERFRSDIGRRVLFEMQEHDPITVEYDLSPEELDAILEHIEAVWTKLGEEEPHWSVVSTADFKKDRIHETLQAFHNSGRSEVENMKRMLARNGLSVPENGVALEYGCGVGRVTRWLAPLFQKIIGVDVSPNHIALLKEYLKQEGVTNAETVVVQKLSEIEALPGYDFLYSKIVLQHNPPPIIAKIFDVLCRKLAPNGVGVVQIPTYCKGYKFAQSQYLDEMQKKAGMEMHVLPQPVIFDILYRNNCIPREVSRDHLVATVDFVSTTFCFQKIQ